MTRLPRSVVPAGWLTALALSACPAPDERCRGDGDCALPGTRCDVPSGLCLCASDEACREGEFCNRAGICQKKAGCSRNEECPDPGEFCDLGTGRCLVGPSPAPAAECGLASHCPYGAVCVEGVCIAGCFDDGDCSLGDLCVENRCATGEGICGGDEFCGFRERCEDGACRVDRRGPYCRGCDFRTAVNPEPCDHPRNFCLINSSERGGFPQYCGVDCSIGQPCPNGYDCNGIVILTDDTCLFDAECRCPADRIRFAERTCALQLPCEPRLPDGRPDPSTPSCVVKGAASCGGGEASCVVPRGQTAGSCTCVTDADCPSGGACVGGLCCLGEVRDGRECAIGESRVSGFCTCATDDDCPRDSCDSTRGACAITGHPCTPGNDDCGPIPCVDGGCLIGQNCAPIQGLSCGIVGPRP